MATDRAQVGRERLQAVPQFARIERFPACRLIVLPRHATSTLDFKENYDDCPQFRFPKTGQMRPL